ncbi:transposase, partial [Glaesserella parasuis]|uniref:transposase n=1 Tax=Glaesserella parasuis TaxID=738 RepID=UPI000595F2A1
KTNDIEIWYNLVRQNLTIPYKLSGQNPQAIGKSVAGNSTKIHLAVDSCGNPIDFVLTGGEVHDSKAASELVELLPDSETIVADRGYDCEALR